MMLDPSNPFTRLQKKIPSTECEDFLEMFAATKVEACKMQEQNRGIGFLLTAAARGRGVTIAGASLSEYQHT